jgi:copper chaperone CopZ
MTDVDLSIGGMAWASCATRIEKKLNRLEGRDRLGELRERTAVTESAIHRVATGVCRTARQNQG